MTSPFIARPPETRATVWLAAATIVLPALALLSWDFDRSAPLALLVTPLWVGRDTLGRAGARFAQARPWWRWLAAALGVIALLAIAHSTHRAASVTALASWILLGAGAILGAQLTAEEPRHGDMLLGAIAVSAALGTLLHWFRWRLGAAPETAFYLHHRLMGLHTLGGACAATALLVRAPKLAPGWIAVGVITWGGLLWTGSRTPLPGLAVGLGIWWLCTTGKTRRRLLLAVALHAGGGLLLSAALPADRPHLGWLRVWHSTAAAATTQELTSNRSVFMRDALQHARSSPWLGYGPDAYRFLEPKLEGAQPHNAELQWWLDFGVPGALLIATFAGLGVIRGIRRELANGPRSGWVALAIAGGVAGQIDGYFYHLMGLWWVALALAVCAAAPPPGTSATTPIRPPPAPPVWPAMLAVAAALVLGLHTWLVYRVSLAPPPQPGDFAARVWRAWPSMTQNLERWIYAWERPAPAAALELTRIAQQQSPYGDFFHVQTAGILLRQGDRAGAQRELAIALAIAPELMRPTLLQLQAQLQAPPATP